MKTLTVNITAELQIPDDWELVDHASGMSVLKIGDKFVDFDITPLVTIENLPDAVWSDEDQAVTTMVLDCVSGLDADMTLAYQQ